MDKLTSLSLSEFSKFTVDTKAETVKVPEGYELYKRETPVERAEKEILRLQEELKGLTMPDDKELIEFAKAYHPYFEIQSRIKEFNSILNIKIIK